MREIRYIEAGRIAPHPDNPRKDLGDLTELAASIRANGILQNLTVVEADPDAAGADYTVIIGHRRLAAARLAGLETVPCAVAELTPVEQVQTMLLENMQRSDLTVYEQAKGFQLLLDFGLSVDEVAEKSGFSTSTVRRRVKMMELDEKTLQEVSGRQLTLGDFDRLAEIEDIKKRNECLKTIGTRDFDASVAGALQKQKEKKNLPLVKAWLKEAGAEEIQQSDTWSNKYEHIGPWSIYISKWGEGDNKPPKELPDKLFYHLSSGNLRLFKKRAKPAKEQKTPEQIAEERAIAECWRELDEAAALAYELRRDFIERASCGAHNREEWLRGALDAALVNAITYNAPDRDALCEQLGVNKSYDPERDEKLLAGCMKLSDKELPAVAYALFADSARLLPVESSYRGNYPKYKTSARLELLYDMLFRLGYEISTEEQLLLNGRHAVYRGKEEAPS